MLTRGKFLGAGGDAFGLHAHGGQGLVQPAHALLQAVEQRQGDRRLGQLQRYAGKARAAADVDDACIFEIFDGQERQTVGKVQPRDGLRLGDGGQVHDLILFQQRTAEGLKLCKLRLRQAEAETRGLDA